MVKDQQYSHGSLDISSTESTNVVVVVVVVVIV